MFTIYAHSDTDVYVMILTNNYIVGIDGDFTYVQHIKHIPSKIDETDLNSLTPQLRAVIEELLHENVDG